MLCPEENLVMLYLFIPTAKIAVMGGEQIAGVMSMVRRAKAMRDGLLR